uniref:Fatty acid binding protein 10b, liver basic n=1 Tax=Neogobius melanostomus TaxID=47308 RepID=A0A8C6S6U0_9GOBI
MDFSGTWEVYYEENLEEFLKAVGAPEMIVKMRKEFKPRIIIEQNGKDFSYTIKTPVGNNTYTFTLGKESEIAGPTGRKYKCKFREENGKLISQSEKMTSVREIIGEDMVEVILSVFYCYIIDMFLINS